MFLKELEKFVSEDEFEAKELQIIKKFIKENPDNLTRNNEIAHITVSAWITNSSLDKVLMIYHNIYDSWSWPGGHLDDNENLIQAARREVREETGIENLKLLTDTCISVEILPVQAHYKNDKIVPAHLHLNISYAFMADEKQSIRPKLDENKAVKWLMINEIDKLVTEKNMLFIYHKIIKRISNLDKYKR